MKSLHKIQHIRTFVNAILLLFPILLIGNDLTHRDVKYIPSEHLSKFVNSEYLSTVIDIPIENPEPFIAIGFNAKIIDSNSEIKFYIRVSEDKINWSDWQLINEEENPERANFRYLAALSFFDKKNRFIQFKTGDISNFEEINFSFISPGKTSKTIIEERIKQSKSSITLEGVVRPAMVLRAEWGCPQPEHVSSRVLTNVTHLIIHHSAGNTTSPDFAAVVLAYWDYHVNTHGWVDIGYNWLVDPNGVLYKGRAWKSATQENVIGAHNSGHNSNTSGICFIGNYVTNVPSDTGLTKLAEISAFLCFKFGIDPLGQSYHSSINQINDNITGHGQSGGGTSCPGTQIINRMQTIRDLTNAKLQGTSYSLPPNTPEHIRIVNGNQSTLTVKCDTAARASEYVAYISTDGVTFTDSASSPTKNITVSGLTENTVYYFKVKTKNDSGTSALTQHLYAGVPSSTNHKVLVVDGFDRSTNTTFDYVKRVANPINQRGYAFSFALNESVFNGKISLNDYETVIWILGDESTIDDTFNPVEQDSVESFLKNGGKLFVSGAEIGWDLGRNSGHPTQADRDFYHNYLKAEYIYDAPNNLSGSYYSCEAIAGQIFDGISDFDFDDGTHGTIDVDWPDAINGINGGQNVMLYKNAPADNIAGVKFEGLFPQGTVNGKLIYLGLPFETIYPEANRIEIMSKVFDFFEAPVNHLVNENNLQPEIIQLYQNYPNPFNPTTTISFYLPKKGNVKIVIYNLLGQKVHTLLNNQMNSGLQTITWDASNFAGGVYYYTLISDKYKSTKKMLLIK